VNMAGCPVRRQFSLPYYVFLYLVLYAGWGVLSPFFPTVLAVRGATADQIGLLLAAGVAVRLVSAPAAGILADRLQAPRQELAALLAAAAVLGLGYILAGSFATLLLICLVHATATGPLGPLPDAIAVHAGRWGEFARPITFRPYPRRIRLDYGVVRGAGAVGFIAGTAIAGPAIGASGSPVVVLWLNAALFGLAAGAALLLPLAPSGPAMPALSRELDGAQGDGLRSILKIPVFRRLLLVSGLIQGSHAFYTAFGTIRWEAAGVPPTGIGLLWSISIASEVAVFFVFGRPLLAQLGPARLCALSALAGALRWAVMARTAWLPALLLVQPLHGLTFAAQHLAVMALIAQIVPMRLAATAQSTYGSLGSGLATAVLTLLAGPLYARFVAGGFWPMALLCSVAVPLALALRVNETPAGFEERPAEP
jgi:PPP family 3-phenylpropionic acid transporter